MLRLTLLYVPDPRLKLKANNVKIVGESERALFDAMLNELKHHDGLGFAASQFNIQKRLIVIDCGPECQNEPLFLADPEIIWTSDALHSFPEGCFSVPLQYANVTRPKAVTVRFLDYHNQPQEQTFEDLLADCVQHEIDHLNGITFIDHQSPVKRKMLLAKAQKISRQKMRQENHAPVL